MEIGKMSGNLIFQILWQSGHCRLSNTQLSSTSFPFCSLAVLSPSCQCKGDRTARALHGGRFEYRDSSSDDGQGEKGRWRLATAWRASRRIRKCWLGRPALTPFLVDRILGVTDSGGEGAGMFRAVGEDSPRPGAETLHLPNPPLPRTPGSPTGFSTNSVQFVGSQNGGVVELQLQGVAFERGRVERSGSAE